MQITTLKFPDIRLSMRDGHKLRGYFGNLYNEHSELLHNHTADGKSIYKYPLVQYKVVEKTPVIVGINEGSDLLTRLFLKINRIEIGALKIPVYAKNIDCSKFDPSVNGELTEYKFATPWMALNQENFTEFSTLSEEQQYKKLNKILCGNILTFYKRIDYWTTEHILVKCTTQQTASNFKNRRMLCFKGTFVTNALLPAYIGLGKSVSRGFGTIVK